MKKIILSTLFMLGLMTTSVYAANYVIDTKGAHASIQFKIKHLGYSWLTGRFNKFSGTFSYDKNNPSAAKIVVNIDPASVDSNHAKRDKHLRGKDFFDVKKFPTAKFISTSYSEDASGKAVLQGNLTLHGVTKAVTIDVDPIGAGKDPWGGTRRGFTGTTMLKLKDFNIMKNLGPASQQVELTLNIEGIQKR
ncbi:MAG: YceI family protein [Chromatiales bacterium]|nr:YceI family protein [Chromatiales bacterium]